MIKTKSIPEKIYGNSGMVHFPEINQALSPYPMLQHIGNTETCAKELSKILADNIDDGERGFGLRIYVRYCLKKQMKNIKGVWKNLAFLLA